MSIPALIGYCLTSPGGYWQCVRTIDEVEVLRHEHGERTVQALVAFTDCRGAMLELQQQLRGEKCAALAASEILLAAMAGELARLRERLPAP